MKEEKQDVESKDGEKGNNRSAKNNTSLGINRIRAENIKCVGEELINHNRCDKIQISSYMYKLFESCYFHSVAYKYR